MSRRELERMTRRYTSEVMLLIGPDLDIPAPDMGTDEQTMAWIMDTYAMTQGRTVPGVVTGKPILVGGSAGRRDATGRGLVYVLSQAVREIGLELKLRAAQEQLGDQLGEGVEAEGARERNADGGKPGDGEREQRLALVWSQILRRVEAVLADKAAEGGDSGSGARRGDSSGT